MPRIRPTVDPVERLQRVGALAGSQELHRQPGDRADRERGATTGVAVDLGEDEARHRDGGVECLGHGHRLLPDHGVHDEQRLDRLDGRRDAVDLVHQDLVHLEPAGRVEDHHVAAGPPGVRDAAARDVQDGRTGRRGVDRDVEAPAERHQLVHGCGPVRVGGDEQWLTALLRDVPRELRGGCRLARTLETDERHDRRAAVEPETRGRRR
jgi:hypothetical protein